MNCEQTGGLIMKYFDGELSNTETELLNEHLKLCECCGQEFEALKGILDPVCGSEIIEPPENFEVSVMKRITDYELLRKKKRDMLLAILYSSFTTGLVTMGLIIYYLINNVHINGFIHQPGTFSDILGNISALTVKCHIFLNGILGGLFKVFTIFVKSCYSAFVLITGMTIMAYSFFKSRPKSREESAG